jgi:hypothetical protein
LPQKVYWLAIVGLDKTGGESPHKEDSKSGPFRTSRAAGSRKAGIVPICTFIGSFLFVDGAVYSDPTNGRVREESDGSTLERAAINLWRTLLSRDGLALFNERATPAHQAGTAGHQ